MSWWSNFRRFILPTPTPASATRLVPPMTLRSGGVSLTDDLPGGSEWAATVNRMARTEPKLVSAERRLVAAVAEGVPTWRAGRNTLAARRNALHMMRACGVGVDDQGHPIRRGYLRNPFSTLIERAATGMIRYGWATIDVGPPRTQPDGLSYPWGWYDLDAEGLAPNAWVEASETCKVGERHWWVEAYRGDLAAIRYTQSANGEAGEASAHRGLHFRLDERAADWEGGHGVYRPCYFWWKLATLVAEVLGIASQRFGTGIPQVVEDRVAAADAGVSIDELKRNVAQLIEVAQDLGAGATNALVKTDGAYIEIFDAKFDPSKLVVVHDHCIQQMRAAFLLEVQDLGSSGGGGGSYNLGQVLSTGVAALVAYIARRIESTINGRGPFQGAFFACLDYSYGAQDPADYPMLEIVGLREPLFSDHLPNLVNVIATGIPTTNPRAWARIASGTGFDLRDPEVIEAEARMGDASDVAEPEALVDGQPPNLLDLDPASGGVPANPRKLGRIAEAYGRALPTARNREAAAAMNISIATLRRLIDEGISLGYPPPIIGHRHLRRWDLDQIGDWFHAVTSGVPADEAGVPEAAA